MAVRQEFPRLQQKLGDDGMLDLHDQLNSESREWKKDVLETANDKFERRLSDELAKIRVEIASGRADIAKDLASMRVSLLRWMFAFWVANLGTIVTLVELIERHR